MKFVKFIFRFLYERNWHTGELEISRPKVSVFFAMLFLVILGLMMITILQTPVTYVMAP